MTKEQLARLGQPYYSLKEKGTGLGLMVTFEVFYKRIMVRWNIKVKVGKELKRLLYCQL